MRTFRHILVGADFSVESRGAVAAAVRLSRRDGARLTLVHVAGDWEVQRLEEEAGSYDPREKPVYVLRERLEAMLAEEGGEGLDAHCMVARGTAPERMTRLTWEVGCDLVVVAPTGKGRMGRALLGSTAEALVRGSRVPVWVARPRPGGEIQRVVVGLDYTIAAHAAVRAAVAQAFLSGGVVDVVHVSDTRDDGLAVARGPEGMETAGARRLASYLGDRLPDLAEHAGLMKGHTIFGEPAEALASYASATGADLVVVGTHERGSVREFFVGSTARRLLGDLPCCLLVTRDPSTEAISPGEPSA